MIGRSGAGTVCEFAIAGRPPILVPLAIAIDDDQGQNARLLVDVGAAQMIREPQLSAEMLADTLKGMIAEPGRLATMAKAARSVAKPDAAERLADVVEKTAGF